MAKAFPTNSISACNLVPIASSEPLDWQPLRVEEFQQPPGVTNVPAGEGDAIVLCLCLGSRPYRIQQIVGDRRFTGLYAKGDISITPADVPGSYHAEGDDHYLSVQLPALFLKSVAQEAMELNCDRVELVTNFRLRDLQLEQTLMLLRAELHRGNGWGGRLYVESLATALVVSLLREYSSLQPRVAVYEGGLSDRKLLEISDYIYAHLDQDIKLADLANLAGISPFHFSRLFKQAIGVSPHRYVLEQRVERAKHLLKNSPIRSLKSPCSVDSTAKVIWAKRFEMRWESRRAAIAKTSKATAISQLRSLPISEKIKQCLRPTT